MLKIIFVIKLTIYSDMTWGRERSNKKLLKIKYTYMYTYIHVRMYVCMYACIYTHLNYILLDVDRSISMFILQNKVSFGVTILADGNAGLHV